MNKGLRLKIFLNSIVHNACYSKNFDLMNKGLRLPAIGGVKDKVKVKG
jgi:hypothetical protein